MVKYAILGPVELRDAAGRRHLGGRRQAALLADLLVHANEVVPADRLLDDVWGPDRSPGSMKKLQMAIKRLRDALDADARSSVIQSTAGGYRLVVHSGELDAQVFEDAVDAARAAVGAGDPARARDLLRDALPLWRGRALLDVAGEPFASPAIRHLDDRRLDAYVIYADAALALGDHADAIARLREWVDEQRDHEELAARLMLALHRSGRQQEALAAYRRTVAALRDLGLPPGPELRALERRILAHDAALAEPAKTLPPVLRSLPPYVGRAEEMAQLREALQAAADGERAIACLSGEAGAGKTLLAAHLALEANGEGFQLGWGASLEGLRPPYGAWIEPLAQLADVAPPDVLSRHGGQLARLVPSLDAAPPPPAVDPESERYRLFDAVVALLTRVAGDAPVLLVLDDLQWADTDSLALLRHVAQRSEPELALAVLAAYRSEEAGQPLRSLLAELDRIAGVTRVALGGLGTADVAALMAARSARYAYGDGHQLVDEIHRKTSGNAFFVGELLRRLDDMGGGRVPRSIAELRLPRELQEVIRRRVGRLGAETERVLGVAAVIGQEFEVELLERLAGQDPLDALDAAESAALVRSHEPGRYAFAHALIAEALYDGLGATRLVRTHRGVAEALEEDPEADPGALARHWARAGASEYRRRAAGYARQAGERALRQLAPDEAQRWFTEALSLLLEHPTEEAELCDVLIELGSAKRRAGDATFRHNLLKAARSAMRRGDHERLTRAVLANTIGPFGAAGRPDRSRMKVLQQALDAVPEDWPERPLMTAVLARELYYGGDPARGSQLSLTALAAARRGPRKRLASVMAMATAISPIAPLEAHEQLVGDLTRLAEELDDPELRFRAANAAFIFGMHGGEPAPLWGGLEVMRSLDGELHQPILHWTRLWAESAERWLAGDLAGAEQRTTEAELDALRHGRPQAQLITFGQLLSIRTEQDALDDLRPRLEALAAANPALPVLQLARGFIDAETGRLERAAAFLEQLAAGESGFVFPFDRTSAFNLARSADIALRVGDREVADELYDRLLPYQAQFATAAGVSSRGSVHLSLGRLATFLGRLDKADEHLADADAAHARLRGAPLLRARTGLARAELKLARGSREGAAEALALARRLGRRHASAAILREAAALDRLDAGVGRR